MSEPTEARCPECGEPIRDVCVHMQRLLDAIDAVDDEPALADQGEKP